MIEARRPDIIVIDKKERKGIIIDIVVPADGTPLNVGVMQKNWLLGNCKDIEKSVGNVKKSKSVSL